MIKADMSNERFAAIVEAYGATPVRWPAGERSAAEAFAQANPDVATALLERAGTLDLFLARSIVAPAGSALTSRILMSAIPPRKDRRTGLIWRLVGLAGMGLAGAIAGALLIMAVVPATAPSFDDDQVLTAFDTVSEPADEQDVR